MNFRQLFQNSWPSDGRMTAILTSVRAGEPSAFLPVAAAAELAAVVAAALVPAVVAPAVVLAAVLLQAARAGNIRARTRTR